MALDDFTAKLTTGEDCFGRSKPIWNGCFRIRDETVADPTSKVPNETILADRHRILVPFSGPDAEFFVDFQLCVKTSRRATLNANSKIRVINRILARSTMPTRVLPLLTDSSALGNSDLPDPVVPARPLVGFVRQWWRRAVRVSGAIR